MASSTERFANLGVVGETEIQKLLEDKDSLNKKRSTKASRIGKGHVTRCNFSCNLQCNSTLERCKIAKY
jgi:hypothetical protein